MSALAERIEAQLTEIRREEANLPNRQAEYQNALFSLVPLCEQAAQEFKRIESLNPMKVKRAVSR